ncbi:CYFA0S05e05490g1_1 [Cyberlindnera fabianii]|uniref:CYFA0S05e05490g1_1 n=1 Tax=Cyberlindnera fabianii TaxID=36022 RepID=A0A061B1J3_CYBFA|nr:hypothetical protein BON22_2032 [Cyberlindnera fabianii]CDR40881.1 CYFA0S05e05490g1_1 [Cyberlindnera fabianii]
MPLFHTPESDFYAKQQQALPGRTTSFLGDAFTSDAPEGQQISCGTYQEFSSNTPFVYHYDYDEMKICLDVVSPTDEPAHFYASDETGKKVEVKPKDILYFTKGCTITFEVTGPEGSYAKNFFTGLRPADSA